MPRTSTTIRNEKKSCATYFGEFFRVRVVALGTRRGSWHETGKPRPIAVTNY